MARSHGIDFTLIGIDAAPRDTSGPRCRVDEDRVGLVRTGAENAKRLLRKDVSTLRNLESIQSASFQTDSSKKAGPFQK